MRRSFGQGMGGGGGGGGRTGGGIIKTVHRVVRTGMGGGGSGAPPEPYSYNTTKTTTNNRNNQPLNTNLFLSSNPTSPRSYINQPVPPAAPLNWEFSTYAAVGEDLFDWECVDGCSSDDGVYDDLLYGSVPSKDEVNHAVSSLQEVLEPISFAQLINDQKTYDGSDEDGVERILNPTSFDRTGSSEFDWKEPSLQLCTTSSLLAPSRDKVYDAFHLLQTEPSVQRMVISLSSDKAVWDAVMNNEVVRELRESVEDKSISGWSEDSVDDLNPVTQVFRWIFVNTKEKVIEIIEKITKIVNELVQPMNKDKNPKKDVNGELNSFEEKLRSSFFLSIMVLLIVVVSRSRKC